MRLIAILFAILSMTSCAKTYNMEAWRETSSIPRSEAERGSPDGDLERVDVLRSKLQLAESRELALSLAAEHPDDANVLWRAARAESDFVFLLHPHEKDQRSLAALSALDYATRARAADPMNIDAMAQHAWALGTTTHLQPMFSRSAHARKTADAVAEALAADPGNQTAHLTSALLNFRLSTLPAPMKMMARSAPKSSLEQALAEAELAIAAQPDLQGALIKSKILVALKRSEEAVTSLESSLTNSDKFPRDREIRIEARQYLAELTGSE